MKKTTKIATSAAVIGTLGAVAYYGVCRSVFEQIFKGKNSLNSFNDPFTSDELEPCVIWFNDSEVYDTWIYSNDNLKLHGIKVINNPNSNKWVILSHGYGSNYREMLDQAMHFDQNGFNLLLINHRSFEISEGKFITMGYRESDDIVSWTNYLVSEHGDINIVLYGVSMGASAIMLATKKDLPANVKVLIEDCGYTNLKEILTHMAKRMYKVPFGTFEVMLNKMMKNKLGFVMSDVDCTTALAENEIPIMFIHGEDDDVVPFEMVFDNYYANKGVKELFTVSDSSHATARYDDEYYNRVFRFINRFI